jgi:hypothetical protein
MIPAADHRPSCLRPIDIPRAQVTKRRFACLRGRCRFAHRGLADALRHSQQLAQPSPLRLADPPLLERRERGVIRHASRRAFRRALKRVEPIEKQRHRHDRAGALSGLEPAEHERTLLGMKPIERRPRAPKAWLVPRIDRDSRS